jgi:GDPmannose 4,6-dehydratase
MTAVKYLKNKNQILQIGNLDAVRDWGHARDYVENMWMMLQKKKPDDYVIATNRSYTVRKFIVETYKALGIKLKWIGKGDKEKAIDIKTKKIIIKVNPKYFRPNEVDNLRGNPKKAKKALNWKPKINLKQLIKEMIDYEIESQG